MKSNYGSLLASSPVALKYTHNPIHDLYMSERIDEKRLQEAVDKATEVCPYVLLNVIKRDDSKICSGYCNGYDLACALNEGKFKNIHLYKKGEWI